MHINIILIIIVLFSHLFATSYTDEMLKKVKDNYSNYQKELFIEKTKKNNNVQKEKIIHQKKETNTNIGYAKEISYEKNDTDIKSLTAIEKQIKDTTLRIIADSNNDIDKAKAIFTWVASNITYDDYAANTNDYSASKQYDSPAEATFARRKAVCNGFANLYKRMCDFAGVECVVVSGYAKGVGYEVGNSLPDDSNHAWNAIRVHKSYILIDSTWGAPDNDNDSGDKRSDKGVEYYYFMTPPEKFIYSHLPDEQKWQLLDNPVSKEDFINMPHIRNKAKLFFYKIGFGPSTQGTINSYRLNNTLSIIAPKNVTITSYIRYVGSKKEMSQYSKSTRNGENVNIKINFPYRGSYIIDIYAGIKDVKSDGSWSLNSDRVLSYRYNVL